MLNIIGYLCIIHHIRLVGLDPYVDLALINPSEGNDRRSPAIWAEAGKSLRESAGIDGIDGHEFS
jgi:hypothetical protein